MTIVPKRVTKLLVVVAVVAAISVGAVPPASASAPGHSAEKVAVVVGVDKHQGKTRTNVGGVGDANEFTQVLRSNGWHEGNIWTLTDGEATLNNIRRALDWLQERSHNNSFAVFHFSGHVKLIKGDKDRDGEKVDEYLWAHDNRFMSDRELSERLNSMHGWVWADISGCEAAGLDDGFSGPRHLFTGSSQENEKSYEHPHWRNSVFTGLLVDRAMLQGAGDYDGNGRVSIHEAFHLAVNEAPEVTRGQKKGAQHPYAAGGDGSEWFLRAPPPPPPPSAPPEPSCWVSLVICISG